MALRTYHCDIVLIYYKGCELPTLWRGTSHVTVPSYPLFHVAPSNKAVSSPLALLLYLLCVIILLFRLLLLCLLPVFIFTFVYLAFLFFPFRILFG